MKIKIDKYKSTKWYQRDTNQEHILLVRFYFKRKVFIHSSSDWLSESKKGGCLAVVVADTATKLWYIYIEIMMFNTRRHFNIFGIKWNVNEKKTRKQIYQKKNQNHNEDDIKLKREKMCLWWFVQFIIVIGNKVMQKAKSYQHQNQFSFSLIRDYLYWINTFSNWVSALCISILLLLLLNQRLCSFC